MVTSYLYPSSNSAVSGSWANPTKNYSDNNQYTNPTADNNSHSWATFGFSIPAGSTIDGIEVELGMYGSSFWSPSVLVALSYNNGTNYTSTKTAAGNVDTETVRTLGGSTDTWGRTWSASEFNDGNFRVRLQGSGNFNSQFIRVDYVRVRVYYTPGDLPPSVALNTADNTETTDTTPTVEFTGTDDNSSDIVYEIQWSTSTDFTSPLLDKTSDTHSGFVNTVSGGDTSPFNSGQKISYTVQAGDAFSRGSYYYRVRAKDPSGSNTWSSWSATRAIHIYNTDQEITSSILSSMPTTTDHPYSDGAYSFTDTNYSAVDSDDATRYSWTGGASTKPHMLLKQQIDLGAGFYVNFDGQVDKDFSLSTVVVDQVTTHNGGTVTSPPYQTSFSHTQPTGKSDTILVVHIGYYDGGSGSGASSVTYGGNALTKLTGHGSGNETEVWYLKNPPTGANTVLITFTGVNYPSCAAISFSGVDQTTPFNVYGGSTAFAQSISTSVTTTVNDCLVVAACIQNQPGAYGMSPGAGQTEQYEISGSVTNLEGSTKLQATAGSVTMQTNTSYPAALTMAQTVYALQPAAIAPSIKIDIWNNSTSAWDNVADKTNPTADTDFSYSIDKSSGYSNYVDGSGWVKARVYADYTPSVTLRVDRFTIDVAATPKSVSDSGSGSEGVSITALTSLADSGAGSDAKSILNSFSLADSASAVDLTGVINNFSISDTGSGSDVITSPTVTIPLADLASATESISIANSFSLSDSGAGTDTKAITVTFSLSDTGSGVDAISVFVPISLSDSASGSEALSILSYIALSDSAAASDALSIIAAFALSDSGSLSDEALSILADIALSDSAAADDELDVTDLQYNLDVFDSAEGNDALDILVSLSLQDTANISEVVAILSAVALSDSGSSSEALSLLTTLALDETGSGADVISTLATIALSDSATSTDALSLLVSLALSDSALGSELVSFLINISLADSATASDIVFALGLFALSDSGTASEVISILSTLALSDSAVHTDALSILVNVALSDNASGLDIASLFTTLSLIDSGTAIEDLFTGTAFDITDSGSGSDTIALFNQLFVQDSAISSEVLSILAQIAVSDSGNSAESVQILANIAINDTGLGSEIVNILANLYLNDTAVGSEVVNIFKQFAVSDSGAGVDSLAILAVLALNELGYGADIVSNLTNYLTVTDQATGTDVVDYSRLLDLLDEGLGIDDIILEKEGAILPNKYPLVLDAINNMTIITQGNKITSLEVKSKKTIIDSDTKRTVLE